MGCPHWGRPAAGQRRSAGPRQLLVPVPASSACPASKPQLASLHVREQKTSILAGLCTRVTDSIAPCPLLAESQLQRCHSGWCPLARMRKLWGFVWRAYVALCTITVTCVVVIGADLGQRSRHLERQQQSPKKARRSRRGATQRRRKKRVSLTPEEEKALWIQETRTSHLQKRQTNQPGDWLLHQTRMRHALKHGLAALRREAEWELDRAAQGHGQQLL